MVKKNHSQFDSSFEPIRMKPIDLYKNNQTPKEKNKSNLTQTQKNKIKNITGKCEISNCKNAPYHVHHIKFLEEGGTDAYSNLIVLCSNHHNDSHGKNPNGKIIPKSRLKELVKNRSKTRADQIKAVLAIKRSNNSAKPSSRNPFGF